MKWHTLSDAGVSIVRQLAEDSQAWLNRRAKMIRALQALGRLREPAAIPPITHCLGDDDSCVAEEAAAVLQELSARVSPGTLPTLDERVRAESYYGFQSDRWRSFAATVIARFRGGPNHSLVLGLTSCHASGYIREAAVEAMDGEITSGGEIPFLLLRLDDWVPVVRQRAEQAISRRLTDGFRRYYLENLSLVEQLKKRLRASDSAALQGIESLLRADVEALVDGALAGESGARRFGLSLALHALNAGDVEQPTTVLRKLTESSDPGARLQVARWLVNPATAAELKREFLPRLLRDRAVAVRRVALGWCVSHEPANHMPTLRAALLDQSSVVRGIAQFHLPKLESTDLRTFYRAAVCRPEGRLLKPALGGLGEIGAPADAELVVTMLDAPEPKIRRAALGALAKVALETHVEIFVTALQSSTPGLSRQGRLALDRHASAIGADRLWAVFTETEHPHVRRQTLYLINRLPKWQKLPLLIEIFGACDGAMRSTAENFLRNWFWSYNRTHQIRPTTSEIDRLSRAATRVNLEGTLGLEVRSILDAFES